MSATVRAGHIELLVDINEFFNRVGIIGHYEELEWLGFIVDNFGGSFWPERVTELQRFCLENPEYHIVTYTDSGRYANKYVAGKGLYRLAKGDKNPSLVLNHFIDPKRELVAEDMICAALAILDEVKTGDN